MNKLCMRIYVYTKVIHIPSIHDSCNTERFTVTPHSCLLFTIVGITPTTAVNTVTLTTPTTAVNIATPTGPHPSSTGNIVQFDGLCLCIVSDRRTIKDVHK